MKIVLLPGMDGTGEMFAPILSALAGHETLVLPLPDSDEQDYQTLSSYVQSRLPDDEYVLLAESFSGPIAVELAVRKPVKLKAVILVATFLSPPSKFLLMMSKVMPVGILAKLPFIRLAYKAMLFGRGTNREMVDRFSSLLRDIKPAVIRKRLGAVKQLRLPKVKKTITVPCIYLQASDDRLVDSAKAGEFAGIFRDLQIEKVKGPHFLLQTNPQGCWTILEKFISRFTDR